MRMVLLGLSLLMASDVYAQTCIPKPDCADMGYTETSCSGGSLKCPFDTTKLFCTSTSSSVVRCKVGMIYYSNGNCSNEYSSSYGIALGIVVAGDTLVMSRPVKLSRNGNSSFVSGVHAWSSVSEAKLDMNGKINTETFMTNWEAAGYTYDPYANAFTYCSYYNTIGTKKGDWYLPAAGELYSYFYGNYSTLETVLQNVWEDNYAESNDQFWSSSARSSNYGWYLRIYGDNNLSTTDNYENFHVSCFLAI